MRRSRRSVVYALHDSHVAALLDQAVHHTEHLRLGVVDAPAGVDTDAIAAGPELSPS